MVQGRAALRWWDPSVRPFYSDDDLQFWSRVYRLFNYYLITLMLYEIYQLLQTSLTVRSCPNLASWSLRRDGRRLASRYCCTATVHCATVTACESTLRWSCSETLVLHHFMLVDHASKSRTLAMRYRREDYVHHQVSSSVRVCTPKYRN